MLHFPSWSQSTQKQSTRRSGPAWAHANKGILCLSGMADAEYDDSYDRTAEKKMLYTHDELSSARK